MFDAIGEGHKIMHEGPKPELDLDAILAIVDGYDARMKIVREYFDRREPVPEKYKQYLATLADGEAVKAFEALRPLVARIRELEEHKRWLAGYAESAHTCSQCPAKHYDLCPPKEEDRARFSRPCINALIQWAELVTREDAEREYPLPWETKSE